MSKIQSVFGTYADKLQVIVDTAKSKFAPVWYTKYFTMGTPKTSLTYTTAIGRSRIEAAASIVNRNSTAPVRSRQGLEKLSGEIPAIMEKFKMEDADYRDYLTLQAMTTSDEVKKRQILDLIWGDVEKVGNAAHKKLDLMVLEALSTGFITVTVTNNPDGAVLTDSIDLLMPSENFAKVVAVWTDATNSKPITDIMNVIKTAEDTGKQFSKMLMTRSRFFLMAAAQETRNMISGFLRINTRDQITPTIDQVNQYLAANLLPAIEIVNEVIGIEKDGKIQTVRPFKDENVTFIPSGNLGTIHNAVAIESISPVPSVSYATYNNALISKWKENEPFGEYTKVEFNAFPGVDSIDNIFILQTNVVAS